MRPKRANPSSARRPGHPSHRPQEERGDVRPHTRPHTFRERTRRRVVFAIRSSRSYGGSGVHPIHRSPWTVWVGTWERPVRHPSPAHGPSQPQSSEQDHRPQPTPSRAFVRPVCATPEPAIMVRVHQPVEARSFRRLDPTDVDLGQREALWRFPENRVGVRIRRYPAPCRTQPVPEGQRKKPSCAFFCATSLKPENVKRLKRRPIRSKISCERTRVQQTDTCCQ